MLLFKKSIACISSIKLTQKHDFKKVKHQQFVGANVSLISGHFQKCLTDYKV